MNEELISVVVPIYKVEKYLARCLDSILEQTYRNFELILVDDGSPDACPRICDEYKGKDSRIKVIHKQNGGLSDARNTGLEMARGKWITFIDSDDYVGQNFLKVLFEAGTSTGADISICDYKFVRDDDEKGTMESARKVFSNKQCLEEVYHPRFHGLEFVAWGKLYRTDLFKNNQIRYPVGKLHEDVFTTYKLIYAADQVAFSNATEYFYRQREGSIMASAFNPKRLDLLEATREACFFFEEKNEPYLLELAVNAHLRNFIIVFQEAEKSRDTIQNYPEVKRKIMDEYRRDFRRYSRKGSLSLSKRAFYSLFYVLPADLYADIILKK